MRHLIAEALSVHDAVAASAGISPIELRCLELLKLEPDASPSRLADRAALTSGAVTGILDRLEAAGFVRREPDASDRRRILVRPVPERVAEIDAVYESFARRPRASDPDVEALAAALAVEAERLRVATEGGMVGDTYLAPLGDAPRARFVVATGAPRISFEASRFGQQVRMVAETAATRLRLGAAADRAELIRATFVGPPPDVKSGDGAVTMRFRRRMIDTRAREIDARLNASVSWAIAVEGGITDLDADLRDVALDGIDVRGGANHVRLALPRPSGTVRISIGGGSSEMRIARPRGVPLAIQTAGGISHLRFDGTKQRSLGGGARLASERYDALPDRYLLELGGGVSDLRITSG